MNYACRLSQIIDMGIQPIYVKEPEPGREAPGVGWVRRIWEDSLMENERDAVHRLIEAERARGAQLARTQVRMGERDNEILTNLLSGSYELFVEGCVTNFEHSDLLQRLQSKLYRSLPCPVIIARNLMAFNKLLVVFDEGVNQRKLFGALVKLFKGSQLHFDLMYCKFSGGQNTLTPLEPTTAMFAEANQILEEQGWTAEKQIALEGPPQLLVQQIENYSLVATGLPHHSNGQDALVELLGATSSPILLCWQ